MADEFDIYVMKRKLDKAEKELKKAKRILKSAANVLDKFIPCDEDYCNECIRRDKNCDYDDSFDWLYLDETEKLLNE